MAVSIFITNSASGIITKADLRRFLEMCDADNLPEDLIIHGETRGGLLGLMSYRRLTGLRVSSRDRVRYADEEFDEGVKIRAEMNLPLTAATDVVIGSLRERHEAQKRSPEQIDRSLIERVAAASGSTTSVPEGLVEHVRTTRLAFRQLSSEAEDARTILGQSLAMGTEEYLAELQTLSAADSLGSEVIVALAGMPEETSLGDAMAYIKTAVDAFRNSTSRERKE